MAAVFETRSIAPPSPFDIPVANLRGVMRLYDQITVLRSATETGVFAEITTAGTRIPLVAGVESYEFFDDTGTPTSWYKVQYRNAGSAALSAASAAVQGADDAALDVISATELKSIYLYSIGLTMPIVRAAFDALPRSAFEWYIKSAVSYVERLLSLHIRPTTITDERYEFVREEFNRYCWLQLNERPVIAISAIRLGLPTTTGDRIIQTFLPEWIRMPDPTAGQVQIIPTGAITTAGAPLLWLTNLRGDLPDGLPDVFRVDYTAGYARGQAPPDIKHLVGIAAEIGLLHLVGVIRGQSSRVAASVDSVMQSTQTAISPMSELYGGLIKNLRAEIKEQAAVIRNNILGPQLTVG